MDVSLLLVVVTHFIFVIIPVLMQQNTAVLLQFSELSKNMLFILIMWLGIIQTITSDEVILQSL